MTARVRLVVTAAVLLVVAVALVLPFSMLAVKKSEPTIAPSVAPSLRPSSPPSAVPTISPTDSPSLLPSSTPSSSPQHQSDVSTWEIFELTNESISSMEFITDGVFREENNDESTFSSLVSATSSWNETTQALEMELLGGASAAWQVLVDMDDASTSGTRILQDESTTVYLSIELEYKMSSSNYETEPLPKATRVIVEWDDQRIGQPPYDVIGQLVRSTRGRREMANWTTFASFLGTAQNRSNHTLRFGGLSNDPSAHISIANPRILRSNTPPPWYIQDPTFFPRQLVQNLSIAGFQDNIQTLASFGDRQQGTERYDRAATWIQEQLEVVGYMVHFHSYNYNGAPRNNLYATKVGTKDKDKMFLVVAHLDGRGGGGGADDNASGCSLVLELARALSPANLQVDVSVRFLFFNNEETGTAGSLAYVADREHLQGSWIDEEEEMEPWWLGVVNQDMILYDHGLPPGNTQPAEADMEIEYSGASSSGSLSNQLAVALQRGNGVYSTQEYRGEMHSKLSATDAVSFVESCPSVTMIENTGADEIFAGGNPHWHQPTDVFAAY